MARKQASTRKPASRGGSRKKPGGGAKTRKGAGKKGAVSRPRAASAAGKGGVKAKARATTRARPKGSKAGRGRAKAAMASQSRAPSLDKPVDAAAAEDQEHLSGQVAPGDATEYDENDDESLAD